VILILLLAGCAADAPAPVAEDSSSPGAAVLLTGNFPDPTVVRDGDDYYMTHSHKGMVPSLLVWHSTDLYHWKPISRAVNRNMGSIAAPEIIKHDGMFYIYFPAKRTNWAVVADNPAGPWSDPIDIKVPGIDPGHIASGDGKRYLHMNGGKGAEMNADGLSIKTPLETVYDGWEYPAEWVTECFCLESPKLLFRDGYYHMTSAQGGTAGPAISHMAVSARSRGPLGPWENSPHNPIIRTRSRQEGWWARGHGTLLEGPDGQWHMLYHAYEKDHFPFGRQTLIEPMEWTDDGWYKASLPADEPFEPEVIPNYRLESDGFEGDSLHLQWAMAGVETLDGIQQSGGALTIPAGGETMRVLHAFVSDHNYEAEIEFDVEGAAEAGLVVYYNSRWYAGIGAVNDQVHLLLKGGVQPRSQLEGKGVRFLKIRMQDNDMAVYYSTDGQNWTQHDRGLELSGYQSNVLGDFASLKIGIYTKGQGRVKVHRFVYRTM
jgi:xylan 1,4-beta-xylosidase